MKRISIILMLLLLAGTTISVCAFTVNGINYNIISEENLTAEVGKNSRFEGEAVIPETVEYKGKQYSVTSIGRDAFSGCSGLTSVTIPNSVTSIGDKAFYGTAWFDNQPDGLVYAGKVAYRYKGTMPENTSISLKEGTLGIADYAFSYCYTLTNIVIPNSVTSIGGSAFSDCTGMTSITIPNSVTSIGISAFFRSGLGSVTIPSSVTSIGVNAFGYCSDLISIVVESGNTRYDSRDNCNAIIEKASNTLIAGCKNTIIPNSVTSIGDYAFSYCYSLTSVTIPNSVTSIGRSAFYGCSGLTSMTIPNSVTNIGDEAFENCNHLTSVTIGNSVTSIGDEAFSNCERLTSVTIPNSVTSIGRSAFDLCTRLTNLTIGNSVTSIGDKAFSCCFGLTSVTIPNSVTSIGNYAFSRCSGLTSVTIPNSVTSIGSNAFSGCSNIKYLELHSGAAGSLFKEMTSIETLIIGEEVTSLSNNAFQGCTGLTSIVLPNTMTKIGDYAFWNCTNLATVEFGEKLNSIGIHAFNSCTALTSITIPKNVTSIGRNAFYNCTGLKEVNSLIETPFDIDDTVFSTYSEESNVSIFTQAILNVPDGTGSLYQVAEGWKNFKYIVDGSIDPIDDNSTDYGEDGEFDDNTPLNGNVIGNIFYNIGDENGEYSSAEGCIVVKKPTNDENVEGTDIFGEEFKNNFTGIVFKVPAGKGTIKVNAETTGNMTLKVKIGSGDPVEMELDGKLKVTFPYNVSEPTYVYIYAGAANEAKGFGATNATEDAALKIYGIEFERGETTGVGASLNDNGKMINDSWYTIDGVKLNGEPMKKGIYIYNGKKVKK